MNQKDRDFLDEMMQERMTRIYAIDHSKLSIVAASGGFSCCTGSVILAHCLVCPKALGDLPRLGIKPVSPALVGRFFTTEPRGKTSH